MFIAVSQAIGSFLLWKYTPGWPKHHNALETTKGVTVYMPLRAKQPAGKIVRL